VRFNGYPAADLSGGQSGADVLGSEAIETVGEARPRCCPGMSFEWTGLTYQQATQGNAALLVFPLCVLLVFLVLAALYESWTLPLAVILIVPLCLLCAIGGIWLINFISTVRACGSRWIRRRRARRPSSTTTSSPRSASWC
jgi:multidrug efflux pump